MAVKKTVAKTQVNAAVVLVDEKLAHHLSKAEEHLIAAVKLFELNPSPKRHKDWVNRLVRAQELVTWVYRDELVHIRGPIKISVKKVAKRKK